MFGPDQQQQKVTKVLPLHDGVLEFQLGAILMLNDDPPLEIHALEFAILFLKVGAGVEFDLCEAHMLRALPPKNHHPLPKTEVGGLTGLDGGAARVGRGLEGIIRIGTDLPT